MVRRRIEIKEIEDKAKRQVTFTKRRQRLFQKADELGKKCDAEVAVITISKAGNIYASGHSTVDSILQRYKEAKKAESSSEKRDDDDQQQVQEVQNQREDFRESEIEGIPNDDDGYDQNKESDDTDLAFSTTLPLMNDEEKEDERSATGLAINLSAEGMEKNNSDQEEQEKEVLEEVGHSISDSKTMPLLRAVPVENLELHELEQLLAQMEEMRKKLLNQANKIKKRNTILLVTANEDSNN